MIMTQLKRCVTNCCIHLAICLPLIISGCSDDTPTQLSSGTGPTFDNIWPAAVGHFWLYDLDDRLYEGGNPPYDRLEDIPPIPAIDDLYADLKVDQPGAPLEIESGTLRWDITADATVDPDTTVMTVDATFQGLAGYPRPPQGLKMGPSWRHSGDRIASYGYGYFQWLHLDGDLTPGHEFTAELAEGLADDILLTSRIWSIRSYNVAGTTYPNCVESFYLLDMGIQQGTDENGETTGFIHTYEYGVIIYAPEVGPIYCKAKFVSGPDNFNVASGTLHVRVATLQDFGRPDLKALPRAAVRPFGTAEMTPAGE